MSDSKRVAAAEALAAFKAASEERRRARIVAIPGDGCQEDVTEHVVSLLDMITQSMDWGSDFWSDSDLPSFIHLCGLLKFDAPVCAGCGQSMESHVK